MVSSLTGFKAMCGCFTGLTVIAVTLRFVARKKGQMPPKADDWFMLAALILFLGNMTTVYLLARVGFSGYSGDQGSNEVTIFVQQVTKAFQLLTIWTLGAAKASVLLFYKRIFCQNRTMNPGLRVAVIFMLIINICWVIGFFFLGLFQCGTHFSQGEGHFSSCTHLNEFQEGFYVSDIILDVMIMIMPIYYIIRLKMSRTKKWLCVVVFLLSFVGLGASIARLANYLLSPRVDPTALHGTGGSATGGSGHTRTQSAWTQYLWYGTLEMGTAIVAINLPTLYGLFTKHTPEIILRATRSWTSITSRAFSTSDGSSAGHRRGSESSGQNQENSKIAAPYNGGRTFVDAEIGRALSTDHVQTHKAFVNENVQTFSEKAHEEV